MYDPVPQCAEEHPLFSDATSTQAGETNALMENQHQQQQEGDLHEVTQPQLQRCMTTDRCFWMAIFILLVSMVVFFVMCIISLRILKHSQRPDPHDDGYRLEALALIFTLPCAAEAAVCALTLVIDIVKQIVHPPSAHGIVYKIWLCVLIVTSILTCTCIFYLSTPKENMVTYIAVAILRVVLLFIYTVWC